MIRNSVSPVSLGAPYGLPAWKTTVPIVFIYVRENAHRVRYPKILGALRSDSMFIVVFESLLFRLPKDPMRIVFRGVPKAQRRALRKSLYITAYNVGQVKDQQAFEESMARHLNPEDDYEGFFFLRRTNQRKQSTCLAHS